MKAGKGTLIAIAVLMVSLVIVFQATRQEQGIESSAQQDDSIQSAQVGRFLTISGYLYHDADNNGERDPEEKGFADVTVMIERTDRRGASPTDGVIIIDDPLSGTPTDTPTDTPVLTPTDTPVLTPTDTPVLTPTDTPVPQPESIPVPLIKTDSYGFFKYKIPTETFVTRPSFTLTVLTPEGYTVRRRHPLQLRSLDRDANRVLQIGLISSPVSASPTPTETVTPTPTPDGCVWCGNQCIEQENAARRSCPAAGPRQQRGYICQRINSKCREFIPTRTPTPSVTPTASPTPTVTPTETPTPTLTPTSTPSV